MTRRESSDKGAPRTGDGFKARGRKPKTGELTMMTGTPGALGFDGVARKQPKGWHILNVLTFGKKHGPGER